jgi:hypothetical protein
MKNVEELMVEILRLAGPAGIADNAHRKADYIGVAGVGGMVFDPGESLHSEIIRRARDFL